MNEKKILKDDPSTPEKVESILRDRQRREMPIEDMKDLIKRMGELKDNASFDGAGRKFLSMTGRDNLASMARTPEELYVTLRGLRAATEARNRGMAPPTPGKEEEVRQMGGHLAEKEIPKAEQEALNKIMGGFESMHGDLQESEPQAGRARLKSEFEATGYEVGRVTDNTNAIFLKVNTLFDKHKDTTDSQLEQKLLKIEEQTRQLEAFNARLVETYRMTTPSQEDMMSDKDITHSEAVGIKMEIRMWNEQIEGIKNLQASIERNIEDAR
ncbi:MAG: hypothetical protein ABH833_01680 [Parcubacteria group bacterium]